MSDALPLPPRPSLEQYRKLAKDFQAACRTGDSAVVRRCAVRWVGNIARLSGVDVTGEARRAIESEADRIERRWRAFAADRRSRCLLSDVQLFVAREHGFASWPKFAAHLEEVRRDASSVSAFEAAVDAIVRGDVQALGRLLRDDPDLVRRRSTREHRSTLLHYVSANGVEDFRQKTPPDIVEIARLLLDAGADVNAESDAYGGGSTPLALVATSLHPQQAGVQIELLDLLLDRGARLEAPAGAKARSVVTACIHNGQPEAAEFLAGRGAAVDLEAAAALGMIDAIRPYLGDAAAVTADAKAQIKSGFAYACGYGRTAAVEFLLEHGLDPRSDPDLETALHWAAYGGHADVVRLLLRHGAPVDRRHRRLLATPLELALRFWSNATNRAARERGYAVAEMLARAGATLANEGPHDDAQWRTVKERVTNDPRMMAALGRA